MGAIKIASRGGQNHQPSREEIGERYRKAFGSSALVSCSLKYSRHLRATAV